MNNAIKKLIIAIIVSTSIYGYGQQELSQDVQYDMKYMVEEEKLARDVYEHLAELWNLRILHKVKNAIWK